MDQVELQAATRETLGKKVRFLRREGIIPAHVFGHSIDSLAIQCDKLQLQHALAQAGRTRLISLKLDKARRPRNVLAREIQRDPRTGKVVHVDFYQVRMEEKTRVEVPIVLAGEAPALRLKENMLANDLTSLTIECLPDEIPAAVEVDISSLTEAEQSIRVRDIRLDDAISVLNDPELVVAKISAKAMKVEEEEVTEEEAEAAAPPAEELGED